MNDEELDRAIRDRYANEIARSELALRLIQDAKAKPKSRIIPMMIVASAIAAAALFFLPGGVTEATVVAPAISEVKLETITASIELWRLDEDLASLPDDPVYENHAGMTLVEPTFSAPQTAELVSAPTLEVPVGDSGEFTERHGDTELTITVRTRLENGGLMVETRLVESRELPNNEFLLSKMAPGMVNIPDHHGTLAMYVELGFPGNPDDVTPYLLILSL